MSEKLLDRLKLGLAVVGVDVPLTEWGTLKKPLRQWGCDNLRTEFSSLWEPDKPELMGR